MYDKILVPLDGSELAEVALPYAEELAGRLSSDIILILVGEPPQDQYYHMHQFYMQKMVEAVRLGAERYLDNPKEKTVNVAPAILVGNPAEEIVDYADKEDIDLIVMATHGCSGIKRWALGSVADKVVRATERRVVLIRAKDARADVRDKGLLNRVLVPLDGSEESKAVIPSIKELVSKLGAEVVLLQVMDPPYQAYTADGYTPVMYTKERMESLEALVKDCLEKLGAELEQKGVTARSEVRMGYAAEEIIRLADELPADLVAMSTHGRSGVSRWVFGSVAEKVLQGVSSPILLVRPR